MKLTSCSECGSTVKIRFSTFENGKRICHDCKSAEKHRIEKLFSGHLNERNKNKVRSC